MPYSSPVGKNFIRSVLQDIKPKKILDVGAGAGQLCKRYKRNGQVWHALEIWGPYVEKFKLEELYSKVVVADVRTYDLEPDSYDLIFAGDVLEHMTPEEAADVMAKLRRAAQTVIVSVPLGHYPQGEFEGNPHEAHVKDDYSVADALHIFGDTGEYSVDKIEGDVSLGTFVYRRTKARLKIAVYAICKNEAAFVRDFCTSAMDADYIVIADTGSTDETFSLIKTYATHAHRIHIKPWRFDLARNAALALVPADADVCISLDLDERLEPGWRDEIERLWVKGVTTRFQHIFDWGKGIRFAYQKTHQRDGYYWHHPCHEYPRPDPRVNERYAISDKLLVTHHPDDTKSRGQYMELLEVGVKEDPHCPRNAFYYARELVFAGRHREAVEALERYLSMPDATFKQERAYAMRLLADCHREMSDSETSVAWLRKSLAEYPHSREPWLALAYHYHKHADWPQCFACATSGLGITKRELVYTTDPAAWGFALHDLAAIAAYKLKLYDIALEQGTIAAQLAPEDTRVTGNIKFYREACGLPPVDA